PKVNAASYNGWIEFGNRMFTGLVTVAVAAAVLGSIRRIPKRQDLIWLSWGLVAGVVAQIIVGAVAVKTDLNPAVVACHFLVSIALITDAAVLHHRASDEVSTARPPLVRNLSVAILAVALAVIMAGTVVTGTGPHGGDETARRFQLVMTDVVRVHSLLVWLLVALTVFLAYRVKTREVQVLLAVEVAQGAIGYTQYFTGVPVLLVAVHVIGALAVWIAAVRVRLSLG
ncbi:MAG: heme a synthase, partial [Actinomycetota bacterium]